MKKEKLPMRTKITTILSSGLILLLLMLALGNTPWQPHTISAAPAPLQPSPSQPTPLTPMAAPTTINIELCAKAGNTTMPDNTTIPIWGYALKPANTPCSDNSVTASLPGPVIEATTGDTLNITLYNELPEATSLLFPGQDEPPDMTGIAPGSTKTYSFTVTRPGTFLYESGVNSAIQVAMGLYGALIVHDTTPGQAYASPETAYDTEAVLLLSEIDPNLNADPANFNLLDYKPLYWLINGKAYPDTNPIDADPGERVLLRYLNAGFTNDTMMILGTHQKHIASDGYPLNFPVDMVAYTIPAGQTADLIATMPHNLDGGQLALYNRQLHITNGDATSTAHFPGGMMTFINIAPFVNFNNYTLASYGGTQDAAATATIEDNGATLHLVGNGWKKIPFPYTVTPNTVIEFDFMSSVQGEIHGIGFDNDDVINNPIQIFQVYGTQGWGIQNASFNYAGSAPNWVRFSIPVGQFYTGTMTDLVFVMDDDAAAAGESLFRNIKVYEAPPLMVNVNGTPYAVMSYGGSQDVGALVSVENGGDTLRITGNGWKKVAFAYTVTPNTVLEFDFESNVEGEIHGIGFDTDDNISSNLTFQLYGTQTWGLQAFHTYTGSGVQHFVVPVGNYYTGSMLYLTFTNDDDAAAAGESVFSNIQVYEQP